MTVRDQRDPYVCGALARAFRLVPICPEMELGLGVPRRPIRLVRTDEGVRVRDAEDPDNPELDLTEQFRVLAEALAPLLARLSGYVFKSRSPSCGVRDVRLYGSAGGSRPVATGEFARLVMALYPRLPVVDERQLADPEQRLRFLRRGDCRVAYPALGGSWEGLALRGGYRLAIETDRLRRRPMRMITLDARELDGRAASIQAGQPPTLSPESSGDPSTIGTCSIDLEGPLLAPPPRPAPHPCPSAGLGGGASPVERRGPDHRRL